MWRVFLARFDKEFTRQLNFSFVWYSNKLVVIGHRSENFSHFYHVYTEYSFRHKMDEGWFELSDFLHTKLYVSENSMKSKAETIQFPWHASILAELIQVVTIGHFMRLKSGF